MFCLVSFLCIYQEALSIFTLHSSFHTYIAILRFGVILGRTLVHICVLSTLPSKHKLTAAQCLTGICLLHSVVCQTKPVTVWHINAYTLLTVQWCVNAKLVWIVLFPSLRLQNGTCPSEPSLKKSGYKAGFIQVCSFVQLWCLWHLAILFLKIQLNAFMYERKQLIE